MQENPKFNGKSNMEEACRKNAAEKRHTKTPDYAVGSFCVCLHYEYKSCIFAYFSQFSKHVWLFEYVKRVSHIRSYSANSSRHSLSLR